MIAGADMRKMVESYYRVGVAVIPVSPGETKEQAWRRYLREHPESPKIDVRIFHHLELSDDIALHFEEGMARRKANGDERNFTG